MATPALRSMRDQLPPGSRVWGINRPYVAEVLAGTPLLDESVFLDPRSSDPRIRTRVAIRRLRSLSLDLVLLFTNSLRSALIAWASGAPQRVGDMRNHRGWLLTQGIRAPRSRGQWIPFPALDHYLRIAAAAGFCESSHHLELATLPEDEAAADDVWRTLELPPGKQVVILNNGGAYGAAKKWPHTYFAELAGRIVRSHDVSVLLVCGPEEREQTEETERLAKHRHVVSLARTKLSIGLIKACVRRSGLMVTTDSGPRHFAAAFGVPVITLFGPTHVAWSETFYSRATHVFEPVPCGPCQQRVCPLGHHRCMRDLSVEQVYAAVDRLLAARYLPLAG